MLGFSKKQKTDAWLFAGLGNPGGEYARHRHNVGFMAVDAIAAGGANFSPFKAKFKGLLSEANADGRKAVLLKPQTYMNLSGQSVLAAAQFYKIDPSRIVVFHDELDLEPGKVRVKKGGGNAGHNGLESIQESFGTPDFWRVRIGIGHPGRKEMVTGHVLGNFAKSDEIWLQAALEALSAQHQKIMPDGPQAYGQAVNEQIAKKLRPA